MQISQMYQTLTNRTPDLFLFPTSHQYLDPKRQMQERQLKTRLKNRHQGKFKPTVKHKPCFIDEYIRPVKGNPGPSKYKTEGNLLGRARAKSAAADLNKVDTKVKKHTYIDDIEYSSLKWKEPGVGKYNLAETIKKAKSAKVLSQGRKFSHMDTVECLAAHVPGSGFYNPNISIKKLKINRTNYKFCQQKHQEQQKKLKRSLSTKLGPFTYMPIQFNTFASLAADKTKHVSRWSHGEIQKRRGSSASIKSPGPAQYNLINQWGKSSEQRKNDLEIGKFKLLDRYTTRSSSRGFGDNVYK